MVTRSVERAEPESRSWGLGARPWAEPGGTVVPSGGSRSVNCGARFLCNLAVEWSPGSSAAAQGSGQGSRYHLRLRPELPEQLRVRGSPAGGR